MFSSSICLADDDTSPGPAISLRLSSLGRVLFRFDEAGERLGLREVEFSYRVDLLFSFLLLLLLILEVGTAPGLLVDGRLEARSDFSRRLFLSLDDEATAPGVVEAR